MRYTKKTRQYSKIRKKRSRILKGGGENKLTIDIGQIEKLADLRNKNIITDEEYTTTKKKLLQPVNSYSGLGGTINSLGDSFVTKGIKSAVNMVTWPSRTMFNTAKTLLGYNKDENINNATNNNLNSNVNNANVNNANVNNANVNNANVNNANVNNANVNDANVNIDNTNNENMTNNSMNNINPGVKIGGNIECYDKVEDICNHCNKSDDLLKIYDKVVDKLQNTREMHFDDATNKKINTLTLFNIQTGGKKNTFNKKRNYNKKTKRKSNN